VSYIQQLLGFPWTSLNLAYHDHVLLMMREDL